MSALFRVPKNWVDVEVAKTTKTFQSSRRLQSVFRSLLQTDDERVLRARIYSNDLDELNLSLDYALINGDISRSLDSEDVNDLFSVVRVGYDLEENGSGKSDNSNLVAIIGGALGGAIALLLIAILAYYLTSRRRRGRNERNLGNGEKTLGQKSSMPPTQPTVLPNFLEGTNNNFTRSGKTDPSISWMSRQAAYRSNLLENEPLKPYEIEYSRLKMATEPIGEGSFGRVYAGQYEDQVVAVKVFIDEEDSTNAVRRPEINSPVIDKLNQEVKVISRLEHPNIIKFKGWCMAPPAIVTELCPRGSLYNLLADAKKKKSVANDLNWSRRLSLAIDAVQGLSYLHQEGVLHKDMKSANLLVTDDWHAKISDFNLSKILDASPNRSCSITAMNPRW